MKGIPMDENQEESGSQVLQLLAAAALIAVWLVMNGFVEIARVNS
jgi:hypothetical protein